MERIFRPLTCLMIALLALAGTAVAAADLGVSASGSATTEHASVDGAGTADVSVADDGTPTADVGGDVAASAQDHDVSASASSDGDASVNVDDHHASASVDAEGRSASVTVDDTTVSTDQLAADEPQVPELPGADASFGATVTAALSAMGGLVASLAASIAAALDG